MKRTSIGQRVLCRLWVVGISFGLIFGSLTAAKAAEGPNLPAINAAIDRALNWFTTQQDDNGVWRSNYGPAMTGLIVTAYLRHPQGKYNAENPEIRRALDWIASLQQPDGSIYDPNSEIPLPNYNTSTALMALSAAKSPRYAAVIKKAQAYLMDSQLDEGEGVTPKDPRYGGIGYGSHKDVRDLSNLNFALQALKESGVPKDAEVWDKAIRFLERVQNNSETNDQDYAGDDGGFMYSPGVSKAGNDAMGRPRSYATMTYAGLLSLIYANVSKDDQRVQAAYRWLQQHWNLDENYPLGKQGLFYGYHTMAKALAAYGNRTFVKADGTKIDWYKTLSDHLLSMQTSDGSWPPNEADRWFEGDPILVTAYALLALEAGYPKK